MKLGNVEMRVNLSRKYYSFLSAHKRCGKLPSLQEKSSVYKFTKAKGWERELWICTQLLDLWIQSWTHVAIEFVELGLEADTKNLSFDLSSLVS